MAPNLLLLFLTLTLTLTLLSPSHQSDDTAMSDLKKSLKFSPSNPLNWTSPNHCNWDLIGCDSTNRVTRIQLGHLDISGTLPDSLSNLTSLQKLELMFNQISGPVPSLPPSLDTLNLANNQFASIPPNFFQGMSTLQFVFLDNNPFSPWSIPDSLLDVTSLKNFSANSANLVGSLPDFIAPDTFPSLVALHLTWNHLEGAIPLSFSALSLRSLWLNGQNFTNGSRSLGGSIAALQNTTQLVEVWLNMNLFTGPIPDLSGLTNLRDLNLRDNSLTGRVPESLSGLNSLKIVNLTNNCLQGSTPKFPGSIDADMRDGGNSFCLSNPGAQCDFQVDVLISLLEGFGYPLEYARNWKGNDPCTEWMGISCNRNGNVTVINLQSKGLSGTISASLAKLVSLETISLVHNNITGTIPEDLVKLPNLKTLDVSYNNLYGKVPSFAKNTMVITANNTNIGKDLPPSSGGAPGASVIGNKSSVGIVVGIVVGLVMAVVIGVVVFWCVRRRKMKVLSGFKGPNTVVIHPNHSESGDAVKITIASGVGNGLASGEGDSHASSLPSDIHVIEAGNNLVISIQVLRNCTNNFSESNVLGKGGFGTVYKGELHDGTKIAVKRMEPGVLGDKGLAEFSAEIAVLTKVRHRNLVSLLGYCLDGNEKLLVYEYMPQGDLSDHLSYRKESTTKPLEWKQRLSIALDVARGVEYLHNLAHQSFIHRDLKPSNILLGDDMRARVSDFGLVRLAPNGGKMSIQTKVAGTFGYLAPEYAVMGRITTKVDVYSFGVILMELITGRRALDQTQPEESMHLVTWFRRMYINKGSLQKSIDSTMEVNAEIGASIHTIAELACHCCARDPHQRPEMGHVVNVISSLAELWKPSTQDSESEYGIDLEMSLPQAVKRWQAVGGDSSIDDSTASSSFFGSTENTQTSIPSRPIVEPSTYAR